MTMTSSRARPAQDAAGTALLEQYRRDGFVVLPDAFTPDEVERLNREAVRICRNDSLVAATGVPGTASEADLLRRYLCIHYPHKASEVALEAMRNRRIVDVLTTVIGPNVKAMQSMLFIKSEGKPGQAWHQDEHFIPTRDRSLTAAWIALDDATIENGCLWVIPGSHERGVLYPDREQDDPRFDCTNEAYDFPYTESDAVPVEIPAGSALIFNGYLLHRSLQNSGKHGYRRALVNHYMSAESLLPWREASGAHFGEYDFRDIVLVAGTDPYAWKGTSELSKPHSRPEKDGGCDR
ncbi:phytanoyl-CoA dioxygenase family protein [Lysobacter korlensis]|uniref:Phytanoyl-CoA dioxygenase family protein n=1 Tax=Lysobacter korlensis TaxID=553636 RepID=A0ABV6RT15_9GAMM